MMGGDSHSVPGLSDTAEHLLMDKEIKPSTASVALPWFLLLTFLKQLVCQCWINKMGERQLLRRAAAVIAISVIALFPLSLIRCLYERQTSLKCQ